MTEHTQAPETTAARVRALRKKLGVTQDQLADQCDITRVEVVLLEAGRNKATSYAMRAALAKGVDVPVEAIAAYLDGEIDLAALLTLRGTYASTQWWRGLLARRPE